MFESRLPEGASEKATSSIAPHNADTHQMCARISTRHCHHDRGICSVVRLVVLYEESQVLQATAFIKHVVGRWTGRFQYNVLILEICAGQNPAACRPYGGEELTLSRNLECAVVIGMFLASHSTSENLLCLADGRDYNDVRLFLRDFVPATIFQQITHSKMLHVALPFNVHEYFVADASRMNKCLGEIKDSHIKSLLLMFSNEELSWNYGWCTTLVGNALLMAFTRGERVQRWYLAYWLPEITKLCNMAVLTREGEATSYLYSPFSERPFSIYLPNIMEHRSRHACCPPFVNGELAETADVQPRWVLAAENFSSQGRSFNDWRDGIHQLEIANPNIDLKRAYVGCSWCGFGSWIGLPSASSKLSEQYGIPFVDYPWS